MGSQNQLKQLFSMIIHVVVDQIFGITIKNGFVRVLALPLGMLRCHLLDLISDEFKLHNGLFSPKSSVIVECCDTLFRRGRSLGFPL